MKSIMILSISLILISSVCFGADCYIRPATRNQYNQYNQYNNNHYPYNYYYVPKVYEVEVYRNHYYSIDPYLQQNLLADAVVGRLLRLQSSSIKGNLNSQTQVNPQAQVNPNQAQAIQLRSANPSIFQEPKLLETMNKSCTRCHNFGSKWPLVTNDGKLADISEGLAWKAFALVNSGEMPKNSPQLDDESVKLFYTWAKNSK